MDFIDPQSAVFVVGIVCGYFENLKRLWPVGLLPATVFGVIVFERAAAHALYAGATYGLQTYMAFLSGILVWNIGYRIARHVLR